jgi:ADP-heptose:LPS heptosyltransferase
MLQHQKLTMKRDILSWWMRPSWMRNPQQRKGVLFAGPWVGEFGWELLNWQGLLRALAPSYEKVIVCSRASSRALYADSADEFVPHTLKGRADHVVLHDMENPEELDRVLALVGPKMDHCRPLRYVPAHAQQFIRLGRPLADPQADVLLHARGRRESAERNWPLSRWEALAAELCALGLKVGTIGLTSDTLDVPGVADLRDPPLEQTMDTIASARLVLGPSSGPMHLASLCGTPHLVWTNRRIFRMGKTSRQKYEQWWNPLCTPVTVLDRAGFDPDLSEVVTATRKMLGV